MQSSKTKFKEEPITMVFPGMVARVYLPMLDSAERAKRMQKIHNATVNLMQKAK